MLAALSRVVIVSLLLSFVSGAAAASSADPFQVKVLQQVGASLTNQLDSASGKPRSVALGKYLDQYRTNWDEILRIPVDAFPGDAQQLAETMQFYFSDRTELTPASINGLLLPASPLRLDEKAFASAEWHELQLADIRVRLAWFHLLSKLGPESVLQNNPMGMMTVIFAVQNLQELQTKRLDHLLTEADFKEIMNVIDAFPPLTDEYVAHLAELNAKQSNGNDLFADRDRKAIYRDYGKRFLRATDGWYYDLWNTNPTVFEPHVTALGLWINNELDYFSALLDAAGKSKSRNKEVISNVEKLLEESLRVIEEANVPGGTNIANIKLGKMSDNDLALVRELNKHFHFGSQHFDVDYVSECSKVIPSVEAGKWNEALFVTQPNDPHANLVLPIREFADYAMRNENGKTRGALWHIRARIQGLQDLANQILEGK